MKYRATLTIELEMNDYSEQWVNRVLDDIVSRMKVDYRGNRITGVDVASIEPVVDPSRSIPE